MNLFKNLILVIIFISFVPILIGKENESTNPAKPMVEQLKLPNYDTSLDSLDYHAQMKTIYATRKVQNIKWSWKTDPVRQRKRIEAVKKLMVCGGRSPKMEDIVELIINDKTYRSEGEPEEAHPREYPIDLLGFNWEYDDDGEVLVIIPDKVDDKLLMETFPYIPEIQSLSLAFTNVTDKGLESIFYLPLLKHLSLTTTEPETHPLPITDKGIDLISKHPSLESISMRNLNITDNALKSIAENSTHIKRIDFEGETISDKGIFYLGKMKSLRSLSLSRRGGLHIDTIRPPALITLKVFEYLSQCPNLIHIGFNFYDFSIEPNKTILKSIQQFKKLQTINFRNTKLHPLILKSICNLKTIQNATMLFDNYSVFLEFDEENPISYEKVMYRLKQNNQVPEYYLELEKPYFDEFYSRRWISADGEFTGDACFIDIKDNPAVTDSDTSETEMPVPLTVNTSLTARQVAQKLEEARKALSVRDNFNAERLALEVEAIAQATNHDYENFTSDRPEHIINLVQMNKRFDLVGRRFVKIETQDVVLKLKGETKEIVFPFSKLSKEDQQYVQQIINMVYTDPRKYKKLFFRPEIK
jgi:hypothetical protein